MTQTEQAVAEAGLPDLETLKATVQRVLDTAAAQGATAAEAGINLDIGLSVTVRLDEVETLEFHRDRGVGVTVYFGQRKGSASSSDISDKAIVETVKAACDIARYTHEDTCAGLADAERLAREVPDLDLYHPWESVPNWVLNWPGVASGRRGNSIRASVILKAPRCRATMVCGCTATVWIFWKVTPAAGTV